jgi:hypothetical protein
MRLFGIVAPPVHESWIASFEEMAAEIDTGAASWRAPIVPHCRSADTDPIPRL